MSPERERALRRIRKLEQAVRYNRFIERNPVVVPLFCAFALLVCSGMIFGADFLPPNAARPNDAAALRVMGILFGAAYIGILAAYTYARLTAKWGPYIERHVKCSEERLAKAKADIIENSVPQASSS
jgi:hypothetical protein